MKKTLLIIEDNDEIQSILTNQFKNEYVVISAFSGTEGLLLFENNNINLVILDVMLPGKQGDQVLKELRLKNNVPIIIMSALGDKKKISEFLLNGANDYVTKPFDLDELSARIAVQLRNSNTTESKYSQLSFKQITLNSSDFSLNNKEEKIILGRIEFEIIYLLMSHPEKIFTKEHLYEVVWKESYLAGDNTINTHLSNLRKKIAQLDPKNNYIETLWGLGVRMDK
ncbi:MULTISPECIES: response regulator transcription factor [Lactococcus]|uniref:Response regulator transcription factor n=5 Tax=Lactococcus petauri TaxID=1940789 RepID=A0AAJ2IZJ9_9LACT|nr:MULTISPECIES: response regulator transcription factor [Lactococcus]OAL08730.1 two-component response regulator protein [Lactococcus garvieae]MCH1712370.1 response regulator transcription factor [Lactococcus petauri]MCI3871593.1 response regulator transcription factor [Lactococcus petauri]MCQ8275882.1 Transcriptional regulatory protein WalR [Lactococcus petauri]MCR6589525.1 response regulator transcription factor [Lactococcus petauri]